jgi:methylated-DNA-[protein]-cysteine S-methyltransferase
MGFAPRFSGMNTTWTIYESPLGPLTLLASDGALHELRFPGAATPEMAAAREPEGILRDAVAELGQYFAGERRRFELKLDLRGTPFQLRVWDQLLRIPHGETTTYGEIARTIGRPDRARAVGAAVGRTPVPIIVPCHRVLGADGSLTGYGGGLPRKRRLLELEASVSGAEHQLTLA